MAMEIIHTLICTMDMQCTCFGGHAYITPEHGYAQLGKQNSCLIFIDDYFS
jgi:hypothetical protein